MNKMNKTNEQLIDQLDASLEQKRKTAAVNTTGETNFSIGETDFSNDADAVSAEMEYLKLAVDTVRMDAINKKVVAVRQSMSNKAVETSRVENSRPEIMRSLFSPLMRIAAIFIFILGAAVFYKYITVNNQSFYSKQFSPYEVTNLRGVQSSNLEAEAYQNKNWNLVIESFNKTENKTNKSVLLAAIAEMELKNFPAAVSHLENILASNPADRSYQDEAEYYLSLAYLMNHQERKSIQLLSKIRSDSGHTYYPVVSKYSTLDLKILNLKN